MNMATMRRQVKEKIDELDERASKERNIPCRDSLWGKCVVLQWVLSEVLTPRPAKSRRKKGEA